MDLFVSVLIAVAAAPVLIGIVIAFVWVIPNNIRYGRAKKRLILFFLDNANRRYTLGELGMIFPDDRDYLFQCMHYLMKDGYIVDNLRSTDPHDCHSESARDRVEALYLPNSLIPRTPKDLRGFVYEYGWSGKPHRKLDRIVNSRRFAV